MTTSTHSHKAWTDEGGHVTAFSENLFLKQYYHRLLHLCSSAFLMMETALGSP